ncbi:tyrosine-type recombinase/integrase [Nonomuraea sp. GTA35]|uniref:tyrosine-type recombinase/integrase n=1 Tax=Nonomuraea sp. GTA35 TaxID=1676746 RepID=UPI0035C103B6
MRRRDAGGLFPPFTPRGRHIRRDQQGRIAFMDARTVSNVLAARAELAGLDEALRAHDFRRTFIGKLLDPGVDLTTAQALVGHASPATTAKYDRRPERTRRAAVDKLATPEAVPLPGAAPSAPEDVVIRSWRIGGSHSLPCRLTANTAWTSYSYGEPPPRPVLRANERCAKS